MSPRLTSSLAWLLPALAGLWLVALPFRGDALTPAEEAVARLPVSYAGRVKPFDTVARNSLLLLGKRQTAHTAEGPAIPATRWLLDVVARPKLADAVPVFRVDHPQVLGLLGRLQTSSRTFLSWDELVPHREQILEQARRAFQVPASDRDAFQRKVLELQLQLDTYGRLRGLADLHLAPPPDGGDGWETLTSALAPMAPASQREAAGEWQDLLTAWARQDQGGLVASTARLQARLDATVPRDVSRAGLELGFNRAEPFLQCAALYLVVFLLVWVSWLSEGARRPLQQAAFRLALLVLLAHTVGLGVRVALMGRPPVTNLYSSAIFVGWGAALTSLVLERLFASGVGSLTAGALGFLSLLVAHNLAGDGDTMAVLQAVLDTNFWLATHVVVITLGYSATFLAGFLGLVTVLRGVLTRSLDRETARGLAQMTYGVVCFATLFSFVGTILGGIWADQSWGRFWGWDPKENGALLIVLWNALALHARWGGMVRQRGFAVLAILGNAVTAWSWFGTNLLGVGLHAYGFMEGGPFWFRMFVVSQLLLAALGTLPLERWRSSPWGRGDGPSPDEEARAAAAAATAPTAEVTATAATAPEPAPPAEAGAAEPAASEPAPPAAGDPTAPPPA